MKTRHFFILIALVFCIFEASAQRMFAADKHTSACSYYGEAITGDIKAFTADPAAEKVVKNILSVIGLRSNFQLRAANVPNAAAVLLNSKRYILYNPKFMNEINSATGSEWAAISILAHEIGHHLNGHTLDKVGSRPETELEADEFSGFVLRKMGASLKDAQAVMGLIASLKGSHSHPAKKDRLIYIAAGWNNAGESSGNNSDVADASINKPAIVERPQVMQKPQSAIISNSKPKAVSKTGKVNASKPETVIEDKFVASYAYFEADPKGKYYITMKGNLVQLDNNTVYMIGRLSQSNKPGYELMLSDKQYNYMYIGNGGVIINSAGKRVGHLEAR